MDKVSKTSKILEFFLLIEFAQMLFFPTSYTQFKLICLIPIFLICIGNLLKKPVLILTTGNKMLLSYMFLNLMFILYGVIRGNPGAVEFIPLELIYPLLYLLLGQFFPNRDGNLKQFVRVVFWIFFFIMIFDTVYLGAIVLNISGITDILSGLDFKMYTGRLGGLVNFSSGHTQSYVFCVPFLVILSLDLDEYIKKQMIPSKRIYYCCLVLATLLSFLTSSRALILCVVVAYLFRIFVLLWKSKKIRENTIWGFMALVLVMIVVVVAKYNTIEGYVSGLWDDIKLGFSKVDFIDETSSEYLRATQKKILISEWLNHPFIGNGTGAVASGIIRNNEQPWSYELSYYSMIFQKGIIGFIAFWTLVINTLVQIIRNSLKKNVALEIFPLIAGYIAFLIANSINPNLEKFSSIWVLYYPLLVLDYLERYTKDVEITRTHLNGDRIELD